MTETDRILEERTLAEIRDLMAEDFPSFIEHFLDDAADLLDDVGRALAADEARGIEIAAHTLKSSAASLGARALCEAARDLEVKGRARDLADVDALLARARTEFQRLQDVLAAMNDRARPN
jgi:HPt (histidine-containing phosphotransfer) domain-containing protein